MLETARLRIVPYTPELAASTCALSQDAANRKYLPDEVFDTPEAAAARIEALIQAYDGELGPYVYPILLKSDGTHIGHVEICRLEEEDAWEIGFHLGEPYRKKGYACEAVTAATAAARKRMQLPCVYALCLVENTAARRTLKKSGYRLSSADKQLFRGSEQPVCRYVFPPEKPEK